MTVSAVSGAVISSTSRRMRTRRQASGKASIALARSRCNSLGIRGAAMASTAPEQAASPARRISRWHSRATTRNSQPANAGTALKVPTLRCRIHRAFCTASYLYAPPGLRQKRKDLDFDDELANAPMPYWAGEIDQVLTLGNVITTEVVFFSRQKRHGALQRSPATVSRQLLLRAGERLSRNGT
jgi:hypothetical protein